MSRAFQNPIIKYLLILDSIKIVRNLYIKTVLTFLTKIIIFHLLSVYENNKSFFLLYLSNSSNVPTTSRINQLLSIFWGPKQWFFKVYSCHILKAKLFKFKKNIVIYKDPRPNMALFIHLIFYQSIFTKIN